MAQDGGSSGRKRGFESRWGRTLSPTISPVSLAGSKAGRKAPKVTLEDLPLADADVQLLHLCAYRRPGERRVDVDDVAARAVRDAFQQIAAGAVDLCERDEGVPEIVGADRRM